MSDPLNSVVTAAGEPARDAVRAVANELAAVSKLAVAAHLSPDGDALGSMAALVLGLRALGKDARAFTADAVSSRYAELLPDGVVESCLPRDARRGLKDRDLFVVLDTSEPERLGHYTESFYGSSARRVCIDHHRVHSLGRHDLELIVPDSPSTGSLVLAVLDELGVEIDSAIARSLWLAISTDTGWFRFSNTGPWAFSDAARLVPLIGSVEEAYDSLYCCLSRDQARVFGQVLAGVETDFEGTFAWSILSPAVRGSVSLAELDGVIDTLKSVQGADYIALITETAPESYKVSLRARGEAEVESIARRFGGGGHAKAAGCRLAGSLESVIERIRAAIGEQIGPR